MAEPIFTNGECSVEDNLSHVLILSEKSWQHVVGDRGRDYLKHQFEKVSETIQSPDRILKSQREQNVAIYERWFGDLYIADRISVPAWVYVVASWNTGTIRTVYTNRKRKNRWEVLWKIPESR